MRSLSDRGWPQSIRLTDALWEIACRYLLGNLSRTEYQREVHELQSQWARHRLAAGGAASLPTRCAGTEAEVMLSEA